jgi:hypothetical protein
VLFFPLVEAQHVVVRLVSHLLRFNGRSFSLRLYQPFVPSLLVGVSNLSAVEMERAKVPSVPSFHLQSKTTSEDATSSLCLPNLYNINRHQAPLDPAHTTNYHLLYRDIHIDRKVRLIHVDLVKVDLRRLGGCMLFPPTSLDRRIICKNCYRSKKVVLFEFAVDSTGDFTYQHIQKALLNAMELSSCKV